MKRIKGVWHDVCCVVQVSMKEVELLDIFSIMVWHAWA